MFAPYGNPNTSTPTAWHPEPQTRGTFSILSSCLITTGLCVWTAVHLNIPGPGEYKRQICRKFAWLIAGIFAPEYVAWTAFVQYKTAREVLRVAQDALDNCHSAGCEESAGAREEMSMTARSLTSDSSSTTTTTGEAKKTFSSYFSFLWRRDKQPLTALSDVERGDLPPRQPWTMVHAFYVVMGGLVVEAGSGGAGFLLRGKPMTLNKAGFEHLCRRHPELLPDLSESEILDKSKASGLAKLLVCVQALWFCVQTLNRLVQGLPISLLEMNTFAHSLCTVLIYGLWWSKPLDVERPTVLSDEQLVAWAARHSVEWERVETSTDKREVADGTYEYLELSIRMKEVSDAKPLPESNPQAAPNPPTYPARENYLRLQKGEDFHGHYIRYGERRVVTENVATGKVTKGSWEDFSEFVDLSPANRRCFEMAERATWSDDMGYSFHSRAKNNMFQGPDDENTRYLADTFGFDSSGESDDDDDCCGGDAFELDWRLFITFMIAGMVYGGLHLTAWNAPFSTGAQSQLWKISGITLASSGPFVLLWFCTWGLLRRLDDWAGLKEDHVGMLGKVGAFVIGLAFGVAALAILCSGLLYAVGRVYIVVACFLTIPHLPGGVFEVAVWTQYFPHFS